MKKLIKKFVCLVSVVFFVSIQAEGRLTVESSLTLEKVDEMLMNKSDVCGYALKSGVLAQCLLDLSADKLPANQGCPGGLMFNQNMSQEAEDFLGRLSLACPEPAVSSDFSETKTRLGSFGRCIQSFLPQYVKRHNCPVFDYKQILKLQFEEAKKRHEDMKDGWSVESSNN